MQKFKILVFTDHSGHSAENSIYALLLALKQQPNCDYIEVASRGLVANKSFFQDLKGTQLTVSRVDDTFQYSAEGSFFHQQQKQVDLRDYDVLFLRLPHPIRPGFWDHLISHFPEQCIFNQPTGIQISGNKRFLLELAEWCPPIRLCQNKAAVLAFAKKFPIVLKPLEGYGGKGIVKIDQGKAWLGNQAINLDEFLTEMETQNQVYLGMKYLKNVTEGDKRIVVIYGQVIGASLRLPPEDSWLCNAAQGGQSVNTSLRPEEELMAKDLSEKLGKLGVMFFGFDTLVDDHGQRVLSEVNTLSIGGLKQMDAQQKEQQLLSKAANQIMDYIQNEIIIPKK
ncbi:MAG: hypothetical protein Sapg2KO_49430 [Saprospiraceae bacterium]